MPQNGKLLCMNVWLHERLAMTNGLSTYNSYSISMDLKEPILCEVKSVSESRYWSSASDSASCGMWPSKCCTKSMTGFPWQQFADVWSEQCMISIKVVLWYMLHGLNCDQPLSPSRHLISLSFWWLAVDTIAAMNQHSTSRGSQLCSHNVEDAGQDHARSRHISHDMICEA